MRRVALRLSLLLATLALLGSCGCGESGKRRVVIRFWNGFTGPDGGRTLEIVRQFNQANSDVEVRMQRIEWGTYYNKLFVAGLGGRAPEIFILHTPSIRRFAEAGFVRPIDDLARDFPLSDVDANVWEATQVGGKHYGLPFDFHPLGMYYNRTLLREAGVVDAQGEPQPPQTREAFVAALRKLKRKAPNGEQRWGFSLSNPGSTAYTLMRQFGGAFFTPDYARCVMNNPENVAALQFLADLINKEKLVPAPADFDPWIGFRQGRVGLTFNGVFMLPDLQKQKDLDFAGAPVTQVGNQPAVWASSHNFCLKANLAPQELEAAWRFIKFYSDHTLDWAEAGQVPVRKSLRAAPRFRAMQVQAAFGEQIEYGAYMPPIPFIFEFQTEFDYAVERVVRGTATPQQALDEATAKINRIIARREEDRRLAQENAR